jgi:hypothetical protein
MLVCQIPLLPCEDIAMKSLSIVDLNFFEIEFPNVNNVEGGRQILPFDFIDDALFLFDGPLGRSRSSGTFSSGNGDTSVSNSSTANAVASAPEGKTSTFTATS